MSQESGHPVPTEEDHVRDGTMRDEIVRMVIDALNQQGFPGLDLESVRRDPRHREAFTEMLRHCRPLPVVNQLIAEADQGRL